MPHTSDQNRTVGPHCSSVGMMDTVLITGAADGVGFIGAALGGALARASLLIPEPELVPGVQSCHPASSFRHGGRGLHDEVALGLSGFVFRVSGLGFRIFRVPALGARDAAFLEHSWRHP